MQLIPLLLMLASILSSCEIRECIYSDPEIQYTGHKEIDCDVTSEYSCGSIPNCVSKIAEHKLSASDLKLTYRMADVHDVASDIEALSEYELEDYLKRPIVCLELPNIHPSELFYVYIVDSQGALTAIPDFPYPIAAYHLPCNIIPLWGYKAGDPIEFVALSEDDSIRASVHFVPIPIEMKGKRNQQVVVEAITTDRMQFRMNLKGFFPYEPCQVILKTGAHVTKLKVETSRNGSGFAILYPAACGMPSGRAYLEVQGTTTNEILMADFEWGESQDSYSE